jgi:hypothetical protein
MRPVPGKRRVVSRLHETRKLAGFGDAEGRSCDTPNTEIVVELALSREKQRSRSLRKMLVAQTIYTVIVTVACVAVAVGR